MLLYFFHALVHEGDNIFLLVRLLCSLIASMLKFLLFEFFDYSKPRSSVDFSKSMVGKTFNFNYDGIRTANLGIRKPPFDRQSQETQPYGMGTKVVLPTGGGGIAQRKRLRFSASSSGFDSLQSRKN